MKALKEFVVFFRKTHFHTVYKSYKALDNQFHIALHASFRKTNLLILISTVCDLYISESITFVFDIILAKIKHASLKYMTKSLIALKSIYTHAYFHAAYFNSPECIR